MGLRSTKSFKTMMLIAVPSLALFIIMFLLTNHSNEVAFHNFMRTTFGLTNSWPHSPYGPGWLVAICKDIAALGGHIDFVLIVGFVSCFLYFLRENKRLTEFLFTIIGAVILLLILKFTMNSNSPGNMFDVFFSDDLGFPSGHALIAVVLYTALAKYSGRRLIYTSARYVVYVFAALLIFLIGVSRLFTSHTPTEVIAGWSAGLFWLSITNYFFVKH
jgi:undecaprenyl-diphosphatase